MNNPTFSEFAKLCGYELQPYQECLADALQRAHEEGRSLVPDYRASQRAALKQANEAFAAYRAKNNK